MVYGHANGSDLEETVAAAAPLPCSWATRPSARSRGVPASRSTYGVGRGGMYYEPAEPGLPPENVLEHREVPRRSCRRSSRACARSSGRSLTCCTTSTTA